VIWAIGLFSLLSLPSGVLISVRAQFGEMLEDKREKAEQKRQERLQLRGAGSFSKDVEQPALVEVAVPTAASFANSFAFTGRHHPKVRRLCACGCGQSFITTHHDKFHVNTAHRMRKYRRSVTARARF
jgi:hypothetical protein